MINFDDLRKNQELTGVIIFIFLVMGTYYFYLFREYKKDKNTFQIKKHQTHQSRHQKVGAHVKTSPKFRTSVGDEASSCKASRWWCGPWRGGKAFITWRRRWDSPWWWQR